MDDVIAYCAVSLQETEKKIPSHVSKWPLSNHIPGGNVILTAFIFLVIQICRQDMTFSYHKVKN